MSRFFIIRHDFQNNDIYLCEGTEYTLQEAKNYCLELLRCENDMHETPAQIEWVMPNVSGTGFSDAVAVATFEDQAFAIFEREI